MFRLTLLGVGAMRSPRYAPAGLLVEHGSSVVMLDGGPAGQARAGRLPERLDAWLVSDLRAELMPKIRKAASERGVRPQVAELDAAGMVIRPRRVHHTSHETFGYLIEAEGRCIGWAPEFLAFPRWARGLDLLFADAAGWSRPILFAGRVGGHAAALDVVAAARGHGVRRLVLAHIGRPTIRAQDAGARLPFGAFGHDGQVFDPRRWRR